MERYEEYKDSGVEWIGEIPRGWGAAAAKRWARISNGSNPTTNGNTPVYGSSGVAFKTCGESKQAPAVLLGRKGTIGSPSYIDHPYWNVDTAFDVKTDEEVLKLRYYFYLATCFDYARYQTNTTVPSMTQTDYEDMIIPLPSVIEQQAIAGYLDAKTVEIDALVADCERAVDLLREYRKAVISEAVTKGLNPDVPTKNSGIEWIGNIPSTWRVVRGKEVFAEKDARSEDGEGELLTVSHLTGITPRAMKNVNMFMSESLIGYKKCRKGDIAANTMWLWQGAIGISAYDGVISPSYNVYAINAGYYHPQYLDYLLRTPRLVATYNKLSSGITKSRLRLYPDKFLCIYFPVPPYEEQCAIVSHLRSATTKIDSLIEVNQSMADKLREYRRSLVSEAVTGKFKVPGI